MPNDDRIWAMFNRYVFVTVQQARSVLDCKFDYINVRLRRLHETGFLGRVQQNDFAPFLYFLSKTGAEEAVRRGEMEHPRCIQKKSLMQIPHDIGITDFHLRLEKAVEGLAWRQWRTDLQKEFDDVPDALFSIDGSGWSPFEYVRTNPINIEKLKYYDKQFHRAYIVMPTVKRIQIFLASIEDELPSSKLWFTAEELYQKDILGKIWWTPRNFRDRVYSILKPSD
jgi:hypothetical protein